jgi:LysM repeat protein
MGHWGWRCVAAVFISVWVVGCSTSHEAAPTVPPTLLPFPTLVAHFITPDSPLFTTPDTASMSPATTATPVIYVVQPGDTLLQIAYQFGVKLPVLQAANGGIEPLSLQIGQTIYVPDPQFNAEGVPILPTTTPAALSLSPPICDTAPTDYIICLGQVTNSLANAIQRVTVVVGLFSADGSLLTEGIGTIEQSIIPPGGTAPYRILFKADWGDYTAAAWLKSADNATDAGERYVSVNIEQQDQQWDAGHYTIRATLHNTGTQAAQLVRAVVTLRDEAGQITGYRVVQLDHVIAPDERIPIDITITPKEAASATSHSLYVEALRLQG